MQAIKAIPDGAANVLGHLAVQDTLNKIPLMVDTIPYVVDMAVKSIPAVLLGSLLNILDGVSCESNYLLPSISRSRFPFRNPPCSNTSPRFIDTPPNTDA